MINGVLSEFLNLINILVLQGSILGPLLFLCIINDMYTSNSLVYFHFADDTTGLAKGLSINELVKTVNYEIHKLWVWLGSNKLAINTSKTKIIVFPPKGKIVPTEIIFKFNNNDLDTVQDPRIEWETRSTSQVKKYRNNILFYY